jgi:23S rRNA (pseudouridine1915-N3)-methyltransferase
MRLTVIAVGTRMPAWVEQGVAEYGKRLPRELQLRWKEIPLGHRGKGADPAPARRRESEAVLKAVPAGDRIIALDVAGRQRSTEALATDLERWLMSGDDFSLLIGGPDGLSRDCLALAEQRWSLSELTLPHPLVRIILVEQLYRAWTITVKHPYHRG